MTIANHSSSASETQRGRNRYLYLCVFAGGMSTLAVEMSASRTLGDVFGASNLVWANVIGLILLYLTIGYFVGGRWADRSPYLSTLYRILIWGGFLSALIPLVSRPVLTLAARAVVGAEAGLVLGSFISVLVLFSIPVTLLGCVSPFAIRLAVTDVATTGKVAGRISAISTIGSLLGTFLPVLALFPAVGTFRTFLIFAAILYGVGFVGLWRERRIAALKLVWMPILIGGLSFIVLNGPLRQPNKTVMQTVGADGKITRTVTTNTLLYEDESAYNYIQVQEDAYGNRYLYLNEGQGIHSQWNATQIAYGRTWDFFLTAPYFNAPPFRPADVQSLAIIGLAGGTIARQYIAAYGNLPIDGIEIDPAIIEAGARFFDMNAEKMPSLTVYAQDGRYALNRLDKRYTVIGIDAYRPPYIPWHLTTVEFFGQVRAHLTDDGVVAINVGRTDTDRRLIDAMTATLLQVFPSVHAMDVPYSFNTILVATVQPTTDQNFRDNLALLPPNAPNILTGALTLGVASLVPVRASDMVFTDDKAPVDSLVDSLVVNFILAGGAEQLQTSD